MEIFHTHQFFFVFLFCFFTEEGSKREFEKRVGETVINLQLNHYKKNELFIFFIYNDGQKKKKEKKKLKIQESVFCGTRS
jgi:hypothetical protein